MKDLQKLKQEAQSKVGSSAMEVSPLLIIELVNLAESATAKLKELAEIEPVEWQYKRLDGSWKSFENEKHRVDTMADGGWDTRPLFAQQKPVEYLDFGMVKINYEFKKIMIDHSKPFKSICPWRAAILGKKDNAPDIDITGADPDIPEAIRLTCPCGEVVFGNAIPAHAKSCETYKKRTAESVRDFGKNYADSTIDTEGNHEVKIVRDGETVEHTINGVDQLRPSGMGWFQKALENFDGKTIANFAVHGAALKPSYFTAKRILRNAAWELRGAATCCWDAKATARGDSCQALALYIEAILQEQAEPSPIRRWKDNEIAQLVNEVRDIAVEYAGTQQLRAILSATLAPALATVEIESIEKDIATDNRVRFWQDSFIELERKIERQIPALRVVKNDAGQIVMQSADGGYFDVSKFVNHVFYAAPAVPAPLVGDHKNS